MKFKQACEVFYDCIEMVSVAYHDKPGKGFYLFSAKEKTYDEWRALLTIIPAYLVNSRMVCLVWAARYVSLSLLYLCGSRLSLKPSASLEVL